MIDETPEQPTDETPQAGAPDEGAEPTAAPDEPVAESTDSPADAPADADDVTAEPSPEPQPDQAEGEDEPAETGEPAGEAAPDEAAEAPAAEEQPRERRPEPAASEPEAEVIPGAHLEPDLVLDQPSADAEADEYAQYAETDDAADGEAEAVTPDEAPAARTPLELAADARYQSTGKRKTAVARVILKPGTGAYTINGKELDVYFPRPRLQREARQPLEATGNDKRMDVAARIQGGGVAAQAGALRHGIARALVEAEPSLRTELKRRGFLTRDPREKERKKAGLKKARKRPQFSKR